MNGSRSANLVHLLVGFETGLYTRDDVSDWIYAEIERHDELSGALLELTTLHGKDDLEVARLLRSLVPSTTREARARRELAALGDLLSAGRVAARVAVYAASRIAARVSRDDHNKAMSLEARFEVAEIGVYANMADVERDLAAFLARFATPDERV